MRSLKRFNQPNLFPGMRDNLLPYPVHDRFPRKGFEINPVVLHDLLVRVCQAIRITICHEAKAEWQSGACLGSPERIYSIASEFFISPLRSSFTTEDRSSPFFKAIFSTKAETPDQDRWGCSALNPVDKTCPFCLLKNHTLFSCSFTICFGPGERDIRL
jgi:hypothetical protein